jgi:hypothetical protein
LAKELKADANRNIETNKGSSDHDQAAAEAAQES